MIDIKLYRKRFIPDETNFLKDDVVLFRSDELLVTSWTTIKPRKDIAAGMSAYFLKEGFKISRIIDNDSKFVYWYCDIVDVKHDEGSDTYIIEDLLLDVVIRKDGSVRVLDAGELAEAFEKGLITKDQLTDALRKLDKLLGIIYGGTISAYTSKLEKFR